MNTPSSPAPRAITTAPLADTAEPSAAAADHTVATPAEDRVAFSILVRQHHRSLLAYARALVREEHAARDLAQEALVIAFRSLPKFDTSRDFPTWVRGIIRTKWRELARQRKYEPLDEATLQALEAQHLSWQQINATAGSGSAVFVSLDGCIEKLPETLRQAVKSFYFQEKSGAETASSLGATEQSIRKRLERARALLRECLERAQAAPLPA